MNTGYVELKLTDLQMADFYNGYQADYVKDCGILENQYLLLQNNNGEIVDKYCYQNGNLRPVKYNVIQNSYSEKIKPRNIQQELAGDMLIDKNSKIKMVRGVYGSGKDYLMLNQALSLPLSSKLNA